VNCGTPFLVSFTRGAHHPAVDIQHRFELTVWQSDDGVVRTEVDAVDAGFSCGTVTLPELEPLIDALTKAGWCGGTGSRTAAAPHERGGR
jgi:hypothetical protein